MHKAEVFSNLVNPVAETLPHKVSGRTAATERAVCFDPCSLPAPEASVFRRLNSQGLDTIHGLPYEFIGSRDPMNS